MATPQPQQPIYPHDLSLALDRNFTKVASYTDGRYDLLAAQLRISSDESLSRDTDLANAILRLTERLSNVETTQQAIIKTLGEMRQEMKDMRQEMKDMRQEMKEEFARQAERHNELMVRVDKLERNG